MGKMGSRSYTLGKRRTAQDETRERIVRATMALHDSKGVVATSYVDIAQEAGVGAATVYRHFPSVGELVRACGAHVWAEMRPFAPEALPEAPAGAWKPEQRLEWLCTELDAFYRRGGVRLEVAQNERSRVPELEQFMTAVEAGTDALVALALGAEAGDRQRRAAIAMTRMPVWRSLRAGGVLDGGMGVWAALVGKATGLAEDEERR